MGSNNCDKSAGQVHNQGEKDAANGVYNPPDITPFIFRPVTTDRQVAQEFADREQYDAGYENGRKQRP